MRRTENLLQSLENFYPELKNPKDYQYEIKRVVSQKNKNHFAVQEYADLIYLEKFSEALTFDNWPNRIDYLCTHHLMTFHDLPSESLLCAAQKKAFELGIVNAARDIYFRNLKIISGYYKDPNSNKLSSLIGTLTMKTVERIISQSKDAVDSIKSDPEGMSLIISELFAVPIGMNEAIHYAAQQLLLRQKSIQDSIKAASGQNFKIPSQNLFWYLYGQGLYKKQFLISGAMRELLKIKRMDAVEDQKFAIGQLICMLVRSRFTNKLPDELLVLLKDFEPLSPVWFYAHMKLDKILMSLKGVSSSSHLDSLLQPQIFFENVLISRVILALRNHAAEPVKSHLRWIIFDQLKYPTLNAVSNMRNCMDEKLSYLIKVGSTGKLTDKLTNLVFSNSIPNAISTCAKENNGQCCMPLNHIELSQLTTVGPIEKLRDDWYLDLDGESSISAPKRRKKVAKKKRSTLNVVQSSATEAMNVELTKPDSESTVSDSPFDTLSSQTSSDIEESTGQIEKERKVVFDEVLIDKKVEAIEESTFSAPLNFQEMLKVKTIDVEYDEEAVQMYMAEHQSDIEKFKAMRKMKLYNFDALTDADKEFSVKRAPQQFNIAEQSVVFLSTDDFIALHPEASQVFQENMYNDTANMVNNKHTVRLEWVFDPSVVIGKDIYVFLCQVFNLTQGRNHLNFQMFLKTVRQLTSQGQDGSKSNSDKSDRTVFRFNHSFTINGQVCLPPIGGVHPEHDSSDFNHKQVKKFLMHGGAHPYFFRVIQ